MKEQATYKLLYFSMFPLHDMFTRANKCSAGYYNDSPLTNNVDGPHAHVFRHLDHGNADLHGVRGKMRDRCYLSTLYNIIVATVAIFYSIV